MNEFIILTNLYFPPQICKFVTNKYLLYMLGAKYGFAQSTDCTAQTMGPYFARESMDFVRNPWIVHI